jgi:hypothetical protein
MTPDKRAELAELRRLCAAALPPPWTVHPATQTVLDAAGGALCHVYHGSTDETKEQARKDSRFIAVAREALPKLLAEVERLQALLRQREEDCHEG